MITLHFCRPMRAGLACGIGHRAAQNWPSLGHFFGKAGPMRADRLVATLLVLQASGAASRPRSWPELEISERTARRDLEALAMAGVPVYSQPGRGGGWELVGGASTDLSGLTADEARALFLLAGPSAATPEVRAALRKLIQALPATFRAHARGRRERHRARSGRLGPRRAPLPDHLEALQRPSSRASRWCWVTAAATGRCRTARSPAGLGREARHLVPHRRNLRGSAHVPGQPGSLRGGQRTPGRPPDDFDLAQAWSSIVTVVDRSTAPGHRPPANG